MASKPRLALVPELASFTEAMERLIHLRTSIMLIVSPDAASTDLSLVMVKDQPMIKVTVTMCPTVDYNRVLYALKANPLSDYHFEQVEAKRDGKSATRYLVTALVGRSYSK